MAQQKLYEAEAGVLRHDIFWVPELCRAAILDYCVMHKKVRELQETFERPPAPEGVSATIFNNSKNLASSSQELRPDTIETARKRESEIKRESLNTSVRSPHFQSRSSILNHTVGTCSHNGMMAYPRIPITKWNLGKFPDSMEFQSWKVNSRTEVCLRTAGPQITTLWIKDVEIAKSIDEFVTSRSIVGKIFLISICLMRWLRLHWKSFSTRRHTSEKQ